MWALGPGVISSTEQPEEGTVLNWRGLNFTPRAALCAHCLVVDGDRTPSRAVTWWQGTALCLSCLQLLTEGPPPEAVR